MWLRLEWERVQRVFALIGSVMLFWHWQLVFVWGSKCTLLTMSRGDATARSRQAYFCTLGRIGWESVVLVGMFNKWATQ